MNASAHPRRNAEDAPNSRPEPDVEVLIVGAGFAGLGMAIDLQRAGLGPFLILEKSQGVGGTWYDNRYPGCACDIRSHLYSFSFAPNPDWSRLYPPQAEIRAYLESVADRFGLRRRIRFGAEMVAADFDETMRQWAVTLREGGTLSARFLVVATGPLSRPAIPVIAGAQGFAGRVFHSQRWPSDYDPAGRRIAVVGTGASAIQIVPEIAKTAARVFVFQRTPAWVVPRPDRPIRQAERERFRRFPWLQRLLRIRIYWEQESRMPMLFSRRRTMAARIERMTKRFIAHQVKDPALRARLIPDYAMGCKRIVPSSDWYPALTRENVELVDSAVTHLTPRGVVAGDGLEREVDTVVWATGFTATEHFGGLPIRGTGGLDINAAWRTAPRAWRGLAMPGFPNLFALVGPNTGLGHNSIVFMIEAQTRHVARLIRRLRSRGATRIEADEGAVAAYDADIQRRLRGMVWSTGCRSWYLDAQGRNTTMWPGFTWRYWLMLKRLSLGAWHVN